MNFNDELMDIIDYLDGSANIDSIVKEYCHRHSMIVPTGFKQNIENIIKSNGLMRINRGTGNWEKTLSSDEYLTVEEMRYYKTNRDAMLYVFNQYVSSGGGYYSIDEQYAAWFPKFDHPDWDNIFSEDGLNFKYKSKSGEFEKPQDGKEVYIFIKDKGTAECRFVGLFKYVGETEDGYRTFELIDDKVKIIKDRPYLVICRVSYMKYYNGISEDDAPINGGKYVEENHYALEENNFLKNDDGYCYGFVETKYKPGHTNESGYANSIGLDNIDPRLKNADKIENVRVVFVAKSPILNKMIVIGWYDNATIYKNRVIENGRTYNIKCLNNDAHLISEEDRCFEMPSGKGNDFGIGQSQFYYIQNYKNAREYEDSLNAYIESLME